MTKDRNDPGRFFGDGVIFKAKLIGILEVGEARGDRMCQEALQDLKMAIRAAGEHKQRITIHVTIDGLRLRDEKTGDSLYHHPVHKISFIAQDMTDSRAFGYIFGSPDSGHRFFGIKTDKAASQVVLAMRDLFQVVFELKKKEIEMARQQIQSKIIHEHQPITLNVKSTGTDPLAAYSKTEAGKSNIKEMSPESVADLVDLEQELSSIQRGITQMERITPNEPTVSMKGLSEEDPFGDSFTIFPTYQLLPPPESSRSRHSKPVKPPDTISESPAPSFSNNQPLSNLVATTTTTNTNSSENWLENRAEVSPIPFEPPPKSLDVSSTTTAAVTHITEDIPMQKTGEDITTKSGSTAISIAPPTTTKTQYIDAFTDLDPLGTGKSKPYIDKKYFFHELKNPPKKVLKDLSGQDGIFAATFRENDSSSIDVFENSSDSFESAANAENNSGDFTSKIYPETSLFAKQINSNIGHNDKVFNIDFERAKMDEPIMMPRDTDPFSPTRKKSDPFQEGDIFSKLDPFEFDFGNKTPTTVLPETKIVSDETTKTKKDINVFNGPLQVNLPPESWTSSIAQKKIERQTSESPTSTSRNRPSVFKQNTVDVISSISSKKMPHLFGQKFSKRDSNSINMRRLQESDSLSENETAPEPPPRPDSATHIEPPPLPPKKQFSDIVIRPRITSSSVIPPPIRYDYVTAKMKSNQSLDSAPPIPLPSRKVGRTDSSFPGPGRPGRKPGEEDDYLTPISSRSDVPPLLPPPQTKGRGRRYEYLEHKTEHEIPIVNNELKSEPILPDITLSQLLTLGIDELATKLNVPTSKLSTMTLVELTTYLSDFIETAKRTQDPHQRHVDETPVFKVNFDQHTDATFVAKFDDNFGEEISVPFVANFSNFDAKVEQSAVAPSLVPSADRYAVFREIIELEKQNDDSEQVDSSGQEDEAIVTVGESANETIQYQDEIISNVVPVTKIDTKITEAISHAKDRYAALRDIILVEDLFEKSSRQADSSQSSNLMDDGDKDDEQDVFEEAENDKSTNDETSPENNSNSGEGMDNGELTRKTPDLKQNGSFMHTLTVSNNDDLEIDEYMNRAISNLSLDSRDRLTPSVNKSPTAVETGTSPKPGYQRKSPITPLNTHGIKSQFNDMSTSPIPIQKSPATKSPLSKSPLSKSPLTKSPIPQSAAIVNLIDTKKRPNSGSLSDVICGSSPEADNIIPDQSSKAAVTKAAAESWAIFEKSIDKKPPTASNQSIKSPKLPSKELPESPCSSDGKDEWKGEQDYAKKWSKGQTSSSSRDLSPWDDDAPDYKKRPPTGTDRHGYYMRHARRMNSCDDDYDYDEDVSKRRERRIKGPTSRSRENFDSDSQNWYHPTNHHHWSPPEEDDNRPRTFDRNLYERGTYGPPPFDKRDHKGGSHSSYDRRDYKNYDKRKYYREYSRPDYDFESYGESPDIKDRKMMYYGDNFEKTKSRRDYENMYEEGFQRDGRAHKARDFFYDRDRKSFDRDSVESYDSTTRRHKSFGSGDVYGSLDSREEFRERYMGVEKTRSLRKNIKIRGSEDYEQDSENGVQIRRGPGDTRSLQRPTQSARIRKSSGSSPWDGEDPVPAPIPGPGQKGWKRPSSASESERRLAENRRVLCHTLSGSDGEKDRRFRRKSRTRGKDDPRQQNFGTSRYPAHRDENYEYVDYDEYGMPLDEDKFERLNRRRLDMHQRMMEAERRKQGEKFGFDEDDDAVVASKYVAKKETFYPDKDRHTHKFDAFEETKSGKSLRREFDFDDFEDTPRSNASSSKFNFEEHGFESDFNSPPATTATSNTTKSSFRFSNDFSEKEKQNVTTTAVASFETEFNQTPTQKLRFDDNVTVSKFDNDKPGAFEDDFAKAEFVLENEDRWTTELPKKNSLRLTKRQEQIKKSESVNIFGRKSEDPFEDDDFFKSSSPPEKDETAKKKNDGGFQWENDFAKFDENM